MLEAALKGATAKVHGSGDHKAAWNHALGKLIEIECGGFTHFDLRGGSFSIIDRFLLLGCPVGRPRTWISL